MKRVLITGFGPFPGAPTNPTASIVRHLERSQHPRFRGIERVVHVLPTRWSMLDDFRKIIKKTRPDAILMFGLAGRRRKITPEVRAINRALSIVPDAAGKKHPGFALTKGAAAFRKSSVDPVKMTAALRQAGLPARISRSAGQYLCNGLLWTALESGIPAIFVHVPMPRRMGRPKASQKRKRPSVMQLARAGEVTLMGVMRPAGRVRLGTALSNMSRRIGLTNTDVEALEQARDTAPAKPVRL